MLKDENLKVESNNINLVKHRELQSSQSGERFSHSAVLSDFLGFKDIFVHHEILPAGRRSSAPHSHSLQEEIVLVLKGSVIGHVGDRTINLNQGDFIGFKPNSNEMHFVENLTHSDAELLVIASKINDDRVHYNPINIFLNNSESLKQLAVETERLFLEPIDEQHSEELLELFSDTELHQFVPFEPLTLEQQRERCTKWAKRRSPDGRELWLNWAARHKNTRKIVAHFQAGVNENHVATIAYLVARDFQRLGIATEGLEVIFQYLQQSLRVREVKAWSDTRNVASHRVAKKLGMTEVDFIKGADHFKGSDSDEYVFSRIF